MRIAADEESNNVFHFGTMQLPDYITDEVMMIIKHMAKIPHISCRVLPTFNYSFFLLAPIGLAKNYSD